ncbi:hypothetical protein VdG2_03542 [Verticillium dahliae VDG2]|nr:hypothetical protein VdG2_03542 [Verticillium dahliae VDG2]
MTSIGPQMPPSPSKRKRTPDNQEDESPPTKQARNTDEIDINDDDSSDDGFGPSAPAAQGSSASKTAAGPSLPPTAKTNTDEIDLDASDNDDDDDDGPSASSAATTASASKPSIGPSLPPKRTIGPSLPPPADSLTAESSTVPAPGADSDASDSEDDYAPALPGSKAAQAHLAAQEQERARRTAENLEAVRGKSLYETHATARKEGGRRKDDEEEDDPSARAFDREKDMALGGRINSTQRRELLGKAKDFGGRFQKGSFL